MRITLRRLIPHWQGLPPTQERKESTAHPIEECFEAEAAELGEMRATAPAARFRVSRPPD